MHFCDLTSYSYGVHSPIGRVRNVGWLERGFPFQTGQCDPSITRALLAHYGRLAANRARGFHRCSLCVPDAAEPSVWVNGEVVFLGAAELWLPGRLEEIYAAPDLIIHYISAHA